MTLNEMDFFIFKLNTKVINIKFMEMILMGHLYPSGTASRDH